MCNALCCAYINIIFPNKRSLAERHGGNELIFRHCTALTKFMHHECVVGRNRAVKALYLLSHFFMLRVLGRIWRTYADCLSRRSAVGSSGRRVGSRAESRDASPWPGQVDPGSVRTAHSGSTWRRLSGPTDGDVTVKRRRLITWHTKTFDVARILKGKIHVLFIELSSSGNIHGWSGKYALMCVTCLMCSIAGDADFNHGGRSVKRQVKEHPMDGDVTQF